MQLAQYKLEIINRILQIDDQHLLEQLNSVIKKHSEQAKNKSQPKTDDEEYDAKKMSFEKWNEQFEGDLDLDEYLPDYGMTRGEFRRMIYERERNGKLISADEFHEFIENLL